MHGCNVTCNAVVTLCNATEEEEEIEKEFHSFVHSQKRGFDIRAVGSNNPGTSNAVITMGWRVGILVGAHDIGKAFLPAFLAGLLFPQLNLAPALAGVAAVLGHIFPAPLRFRVHASILITHFAKAILFFSAARPPLVGREKP